MSVTPDTIRLHLAYTTWASRRLVDVAAQLPEEQLNRNFQTSDRSVLGTLTHVYAADRIWWKRVSQQPVASFISDADYSLEVLQNDWPPVLEKWHDWAAGLTDERANFVLAYTDLRGNSYQQPLWQIVLHVVNHGTHHRGQVSGFLRAMGHTPPPLDLTAYYRQLPASATGQR